MGGALLNLAALGSENIILNGNPSKTFWKGVYHKYTNFGIQMFRIDYTGNATLRDNETTEVRFVVPRYGDLLGDTFVSIQLPDIYSGWSDKTPVNNPQSPTSEVDNPTANNEHPYSFQWVDELGFNLIDRVRVSIGGQIIDEYSGEHLSIIKERDADANKGKLIDQMIGNETELTDPAAAVWRKLAGQASVAQYTTTAPTKNCQANFSHSGNVYYTDIDGASAPDGNTANYRTYQQEQDFANSQTLRYFPNGLLNTYPNSTPPSFPPLADEPEDGCDIQYPSIKGRRLYIPINAWFGSSSKMALPLVALQYQEVEIMITFKPLNDLYTINQYVLPVFDTLPQSTDNINGGTSNLQANFLSLTECCGEGPYLSKPVVQRVAPTIGGKTTGENASTYVPDPKSLVDFISRRGTWDPDIHLVSNYVLLDDGERSMFAQTEHKYLLRTMFEEEYYGVSMNDSVDIQTTGLVASLSWRFRRSDARDRNEWTNYTNWRYRNIPNVQPELDIDKPGFLKTQTVGGDFCESNNQEILNELGIYLDGKVRENEFPGEVWEVIQKYNRTKATAGQIPGIYYYTFAVDNYQGQMQPSGALNVSRFKDLTFRFNVIDTPNDPAFTNALSAGQSQTIQLGSIESTVCIPTTDKNFQQNKLYNYDLRVFVEKHNILRIVDGMGGLIYAR